MKSGVVAHKNGILIFRSMTFDSSAPENTIRRHPNLVHPGRVSLSYQCENKKAPRLDPPP
jgi:hypothetical protein